MATPDRPPTLLGRVRDVLAHPATRTVVAALALVAGLGTVLLAVAVGHCSFAGGSCPGEPVPFWEDDVFGTAATGLVLAVAVPVWMRWPDRRGLRRAAVAVVVILPLAWVLAELARTGG